MNVAVNAVTFNPGQMGGTETYIRKLWEGLQTLETADRYEMLCDRRYIPEFPVTSERFSHQAFNFHKGSILWLARGVARKWFNYDLLKRFFRNLDMDVIHHPFTTLTPFGLDVPSVLSFADLQHEYFPEYFTKLELEKRRRTFQPSVEQATRVIVFSEFTKKCLVEKYGIGQQKVDVVYHGYGNDYRVIEDTPYLTDIREKYGLEKPFLYYPAATFRHKNHLRLLEALRLLKDRYGFDGELVLTGCAKQAEPEVREAISRFKLECNVRLLGYLPYADLPALFNLATLMVFPSLFEGFGLPLVEAMACGCPVVCSNATSVPEVVGNAGLQFQPKSVEDMAEKVWSAWSDPHCQQQMRDNGLTRARHFNWRRSAQQTDAVYRKALR